MKISDHVLEIERGRYNKINREQLRHEEDKKKVERV
jgi:hypothetical protein